MPPSARALRPATDRCMSPSRPRSLCGNTPSPSDRERLFIERTFEGRNRPSRFRTQEIIVPTPQGTEEKTIIEEILKDRTGLLVPTSSQIPEPISLWRSHHRRRRCHLLDDIQFQSFLHRPPLSSPRFPHIRGCTNPITLLQYPARKKTGRDQLPCPFPLPDAKKIQTSTTLTKKKERKGNTPACCSRRRPTQGLNKEEKRKSLKNAKRESKAKPQPSDRRLSTSTRRLRKQKK